MDHSEPDHVCVTLRSGVEWRYRVPNYVVIKHECGQKPRLRYLSPLPKEKPPACKKCGKPAERYGGVGGFSVCCKACNRKNAARQRAGRARRKRGR